MASRARCIAQSVLNEDSEDGSRSPILILPGVSGTTQGDDPKGNVLTDGFRARQRLRAPELWLSTKREVILSLGK